MPKGYVILTEAIKDPEGMKAYGRAAGAAMGGVNVLAVDTAPKVVEGSWHGNRPWCWNSSPSMRPARGMSPRPTRRLRNCAKPLPTAMR